MLKVRSSKVSYRLNLHTVDSILYSNSVFDNLRLHSNRFRVLDISANLILQFEVRCQRFYNMGALDIAVPLM